MISQNHPRLAAVRARVKRIRSELDYANRRMFDIRTRADVMKGQQKPRGRATRRTAPPASA